MGWACFWGIFHVCLPTLYNAIPGIEAIEVYAGFRKDRVKEAQPLRVFAKSELIYSNR